MTSNFLHEVDNPDGVTSADIAIFILSQADCSATIGLPTRKAGEGLKKYYPELKGVIVNCDNNITNDNRNAFFSSECATPRIYAATPPAIHGRGANIHNVFSLSAQLSAKVTIILDADSTTVTSSWIKSLADPILQGHAEYVTPIYVRHRDDTPVTQNLIYPLSRAIFGRRILQPLGVDHAFSASMVELYKNQDWAIDDLGYKTDLKMMVMAIAAKVPICQSFIGHPRLTSTANSSVTSSAEIIASVIDTTFSLMDLYRSFWGNITNSRPTAMAGVAQAPHKLPPPVEVDPDYLVKVIKDLSPGNHPRWSHFLPKLMLGNLEQKISAATSKHDFSLDTELWRDIVYEAALTHQSLVSPELKKELALSLVPIFTLRRLTLYTQCHKLSVAQYMDTMENDARIFEAGKKQLVEKWPL